MGNLSFAVISGWALARGISIAAILIFGIALALVMTRYFSKKERCVAEVEAKITQILHK